MPVTASAVPEWTLAVTWSGGGMDLPTAMTFDSSGDAWVVSYYGRGFTELPPLGAGGEVATDGLALRRADGELWADGGRREQPSGLQTSIAVAASTRGYGNIVKFQPHRAGALQREWIQPGGVYFHRGWRQTQSGNVWVADYGDSLYDPAFPAAGPPLTSGKGCRLAPYHLPVARSCDDQARP